jgi:hypothetical protein
MILARILAGSTALLLILAGWQYTLLAAKDVTIAERDTAISKLETAAAEREAAIAGEREAFEAAARKADQEHAKKLQDAANAATARESQIEQDYARRIAGADAERDRLRSHWSVCETGKLSAGAALAGEVAEQDRLRRESAARIVRAVEQLQSERDELVDRYNSIAPAGSSDSKR